MEVNYNITKTLLKYPFGEDRFTLWFSIDLDLHEIMKQLVHNSNISGFTEAQCCTITVYETVVRSALLLPDCFKNITMLACYKL